MSTDTLATSVPADDNYCYEDSVLGSPFTTTLACDSPLPPELEEENDADITDANAYEMLAQYEPPPSAPPTEMDPSNSNLSATPPPNHASDHNIQPDMCNSEPNWMPIVVLFPLGQPRAPLIGTPQGATIYKSTWDILGESIWAPF
ncbi:hypothetical protein EI94DRAFT_1701850 [Lactarius quietus]|nr:hypothetical protein EI94DRAFT_1701850 [Lactarius quietus]